MRYIERRGTVCRRMPRWLVRFHPSVSRFVVHRISTGRSIINQREKTQANGKNAAKIVAYRGNRRYIRLHPVPGYSNLASAFRGNITLHSTRALVSF
jgi:hypothetical protein